MTRRLNLLLVLLLALWLPVQGYGAVAMPFCAHGPGNATVAAASSESDHSGHDEHALHGGHDTHGGDAHGGDAHGGDAHAASSEGSNLACNECGACHLACAPALLSPAPGLPALTATIFDLQPVAPLLSFTPERLQRPPLSALA